MNSQTAPIKKEIDLVILTDSNFNHIDYKKLWTLRNSERKRCSTLRDVETFIENTNITDMHHILVSTGVNDIDHINGVQVFNKISHIIHQIRTKYPTVKIIFSEITPRNDDKDGEVIVCNRMLNSYANTQTDIFIAHHENLRDETFSLYRDNKHICDRNIPKFAANLKNALRRAYGIETSSIGASRVPYRYRNYGSPTTGNFIIEIEKKNMIIPYYDILIMV